MRYRPFGLAGQAVSCLTLSLGARDIAGGAEAGRELVYSALEAGINSYRLETADPVLAEVLGEALRHVDRKLVQVSLTLGAGDGRRGSQRDFSAQGITASIDRALHTSGLGWFDLAILDEPGDHELPQSTLNALKALRATERVRLLGISGDSGVMDTYVSTGAFDVLATPFHVNASWQVRARLRAASEGDMAIFVYGYFPDSLNIAKRPAVAPAPKKGLFGFGGGPKATEAPQTLTGHFAFLHRTNNWSAEAICLAYALMDPSVSSVMIEASDVERLNTLSLVPDRDMPPGLAAQIEMARVAGAKAA
ncbi:MAG: aldo/keto reductase [Caulobacteraceae bacterium]|nr:aldo/keto reductase [Caulobacteraceae bacterium]